MIVTSNLSSEIDGDEVAKEKAPGTLAVVQDFANTLDLDIDALNDELTDARALAGWLAEHGLMASAEHASAADLERAVRLREAIRSLLAANAGEPLDSSALDELSDCAADAGLAPVFSALDSVALEPRTGGVVGALGRLVSYIVDAVAEGTWPRLKACRNEDCQWVFYDSARNRSAKWCSMAVCGNRMKARAFRARRAGEAS
jgi:predicted RNA-binding Zn ribbon-like protein